MPVPHEAAEVFADRVAVSEVVLGGEPAVEQACVVRARRDDAHAQRRSAPCRVRGQHRADQLELGIPFTLVTRLLNMGENAEKLKS
jgi:hypothetical protein